MSDVIEHLRSLVAVDVDCCDRDELAAAVEVSAGVRGWLDAWDLRSARRARVLAAEGQSESPESMHTRHGNRSSKDSAAVSDREAVGAAMPTLEDMLAAGEISAGHLDAIANAARNLPVELRVEFSSHEDELREHARRQSVDAFTRRCRDLAREIVADSTTNDADELDRQRAQSKVKTYTDKVTGMFHLHAELDPLRAETVQQALNRAIAARRQVDGNARTPWDQVMVDAFVDALSGGVIDDDLPTVGDITECLADAVHQAVRRNTNTDDIDDTVTDVTVAADDSQNASADAAPLDTLFGPAAANRPTAPSKLSAPPAPRSAPNLADVARRIDARIPDAALIIDWRTLDNAAHEHGICETIDGTPIPVSTMRRLLCDAEIMPIVIGGDGRPLDVGRSKRTATPEQRVALALMYRTCAHPDCTVPFSQTRIHHVRFWTRDLGPTDIDNLLPVCERHHHLAHEGGWTLTMTPDRITTWTRPDNTTHFVGDTRDRQPRLDPTRQPRAA